MNRIGFVGLGTMGLPMCLNLAKAGFDLTAYNRTAGKAEPLAKAGAMVAPTLAELFGQTGWVVLMLAGPEAIDAVLDPLISDRPELLSAS